MYELQKAMGIENRIKGKIAYDISSFIVLPHLITGRREKCEKYLVLGIFLTETFYQRTPLLKLAQRGGMKPNVLCRRVHLLTEDTEGIMLTFPHLPHLITEEAGYPHSNEVEKDKYIIHLILIAFLCRNVHSTRTKHYCVV